VTNEHAIELLGTEIALATCKELAANRRTIA
jgi:hypothetical protein